MNHSYYISAVRVDVVPVLGRLYFLLQLSPLFFREECILAFGLRRIAYGLIVVLLFHSLGHLPSKSQLSVHVRRGWSCVNVFEYELLLWRLFVLLECPIHLNSIYYNAAS